MPIAVPVLPGRWPHAAHRDRPCTPDGPVAYPGWVRLFFVEEFLPYSWAFLPAGASLQCSFRGDSNQASAYPRLSGGQPSLETVPNTVGLSPPQARSLLDIRAAFWYGAVGREAGLRWL